MTGFTQPMATEVMSNVHNESIPDRRTVTISSADKLHGFKIPKLDRSNSSNISSFCNIF